MKNTLLIIAAAVGLATLSQAAILTPVSVTGTGSYNNSPALIADGTIPSESTGWTSATNVYWNGTAVSLILDLGSVFSINDILVSVDNNDNYAISYAETLGSWSILTTILSSYGEIGYGMDTMSSVSGNAEYISGIDFSSVNARYVKIEATGGDNSYSVGELQIDGNAIQQAPHGVPDSGSTALMIFGSLIGLAALRRKFNK